MKRVLLVGIEYSGAAIDDVEIETKGFCRRDICPDKAADALYDYDLIIIYPESYSHFIFGRASRHSGAIKELWNLKEENPLYDLDTIFDFSERQKEMDAAIKYGTRVVWMVVSDNWMNFYGKRTLYSGYVHQFGEAFGKENEVKEKHSKKLQILRNSVLDDYFLSLTENGWRLCWESNSEASTQLVSTLEGYSLGVECTIHEKKAWFLTPTDSQASLEILIKSLLSDTEEEKYCEFEGVFLSHNSEDKPFARNLKEMLNEKGVQNVWIDEAEILIGDSLIKKIGEGISKTTYFGVILSPRSIKSPWVEAELESAMSLEMKGEQVKVLPILYEKCELPPFLVSKLYADFTEETKYQESLGKLLRRLKKQSKMDYYLFWVVAKAISYAYEREGGQWSKSASKG